MMKHFCIYENTGEVVLEGACSEQDIALQAQPGRSMYVGDLPNKRFYIDERGKPVELPDQPNPEFVFDYTTKEWFDPRTNETEWVVVRAERNRRLTASDWTQLPDVPLATKEAWSTYRQALRDITNQPDPFNIVWPMPPV